MEAATTPTSTARVPSPSPSCKTSLTALLSLNLLEEVLLFFTERDASQYQTCSASSKNLIQKFARKEGSLSVWAGPLRLSEVRQFPLPKERLDVWESPWKEPEDLPQSLVQPRKDVLLSFDSSAGAPGLGALAARRFSLSSCNNKTAGEEKGEENSHSLSDGDQNRQADADGDRDRKAQCRDSRDGDGHGLADRILLSGGYGVFELFDSEVPMPCCEVWSLDLKRGFFENKSLGAKRDFSSSPPPPVPVSTKEGGETGEEKEGERDFEWTLNAMMSENMLDDPLADACRFRGSDCVAVPLCASSPFEKGQRLVVFSHLPRGRHGRVIASASRQFGRVSVLECKSGMALPFRLEREFEPPRWEHWCTRGRPPSARNHYASCTASLEVLGEARPAAVVSGGMGARRLFGDVYLLEIPDDPSDGWFSWHRLEPEGDVDVELGRGGGREGEKGERKGVGKLNEDANAEGRGLSCFGKGGTAGKGGEGVHGRIWGMKSEQRETAESSRGLCKEKEKEPPVASTPSDAVSGRVPARRFGHSLTAVGSRLFLFGGRGDSVQPPAPRGEWNRKRGGACRGGEEEGVTASLPLPKKGTEASLSRSGGRGANRQVKVDHVTSAVSKTPGESAGEAVKTQRTRGGRPSGGVVIQRDGTHGPGAVQRNQQGGNGGASSASLVTFGDLWMLCRDKQKRFQQPLGEESGCWSRGGSEKEDVSMEARSLLSPGVGGEFRNTSPTLLPRGPSSSSSTGSTREVSAGKGKREPHAGRDRERERRPRCRRPIPRKASDPCACSSSSSSSSPETSSSDSDANSSNSKGRRVGGHPLRVILPKSRQRKSTGGQDKHKQAQRELAQAKADEGEGHGGEKSPSGEGRERENQRKSASGQRTIPDKSGLFQGRTLERAWTRSSYKQMPDLPLFCREEVVSSFSSVRKKGSKRRKETTQQTESKTKRTHAEENENEKEGGGSPEEIPDHKKKPPQPQPNFERAWTRNSYRQAPDLPLFLPPATHARQLGDFLQQRHTGALCSGESEREEEGGSPSRTKQVGGQEKKEGLDAVSLSSLAMSASRENKRVREIEKAKKEEATGSSGKEGAGGKKRKVHEDSRPLSKHRSSSASSLSLSLSLHEKEKEEVSERETGRAHRKKRKGKAPSSSSSSEGERERETAGECLECRRKDVTAGWKWKSIAQRGRFPGPRVHHSADSLGPRLLIFGGWRDGAFLCDLFSLDTSSFVWTEIELDSAWQPSPLSSFSVSRDLPFEGKGPVSSSSSSSTELSFHTPSSKKKEKEESGDGGAVLSGRSLSGSTVSTALSESLPPALTLSASFPPTDLRTHASRLPPPLAKKGGESGQLQTAPQREGSASVPPSPPSQTPPPEPAHPNPSEPPTPAEQEQTTRPQNQIPSADTREGSASLNSTRRNEKEGISQTASPTLSTGNSPETLLRKVVSRSLDLCVSASQEAAVESKEDNGSGAEDVRPRVGAKTPEASGGTETETGREKERATGCSSSSSEESKSQSSAEKAKEKEPERETPVGPPRAESGLRIDSRGGIWMFGGTVRFAELGKNVTKAWFLDNFMRLQVEPAD
uniref:Uncharacterized protein n=1 Tax=Chromera velia CCMP2878 TaxID=1169474 RepID=A0A0G4FFJ5_9ALVE|eukprot:Cvel_16665.t1-p1 / transcript=Cvel_16665.t1 / gene=Cvel_16665 / organism=Chromera_velia_CCMP2878 / gene_product=hypothetical protein / transcript_product=hypothetical protein / location=Cvel_scaffold1293:6346-16686(-) / protein_length=1570 / sequence_SO=supercontig / SO=protein_coding / is_pseudo=false